MFLPESQGRTALQGCCSSELSSKWYLNFSKEVIVYTLKIKGASAQPVAKFGLQQTESCISSF